MRNVADGDIKWRRIHMQDIPKLGCGGCNIAALGEKEGDVEIGRIGRWKRYIRISTKVTYKCPSTIR